MKRSIHMVMITWASALVLSASAANQFHLESVRDGTRFGPFVFAPGSTIQVDSGTYLLKAQGRRAFSLVSSTTAHTYGVYELVGGRIIEIGDALYTIVDIRGNTSPEDLAATSTHSAQTSRLRIGIEAELFNAVAYDWEVKGLDDGSGSAIERNTIRVLGQYGFLTASLGIVTRADWEETVDGTGMDFQDATVSEGIGWVASIGLDIPVFTEGRWQSHVHANASYRQETYTAAYSAQSLAGITTTYATNVMGGATNIQPTAVTTNFAFSTVSEDSTLTETAIELGVDLAYATDTWTAFAGISVFPLLETDLDATFRTPMETYELTLKRSHPVLATVGVRADLLGFTCHVAGDFGSAATLRVGVSHGF